MKSFTHHCKRVTPTTVSSPSRTCITITRAHNRDASSAIVVLFFILSAAPILNPSRSFVISSRTSMAAAPPLVKMKDTFKSALQNANRSSHCTFVEEDDHCATCRFSNYKLLRNPNLGERRSCPVSSTHCTVKLVNRSIGQWSSQRWSNSGQNCKNGQTKGA